MRDNSDKKTEIDSNRQINRDNKTDVDRQTETNRHSDRQTDIRRQIQNNNSLLTFPETIFSYIWIG